jgi:hypothetical protein
MGTRRVKAADYRATMLEDELQEQIRKLARTFGWKYYHTHNSRRSPEGFPDVVLVRAGVLIFAELKREGLNPTRAQKSWIDALGEVEDACIDLMGGLFGPYRPLKVFVWRPSDLPEIERILR